MRLDNFKIKNPIFGFALHAFLHYFAATSRRAVQNLHVRVCATATVRLLHLAVFACAWSSSLAIYFVGGGLLVARPCIPPSGCNYSGFETFCSLLPAMDQEPPAQPSFLSRMMAGLSSPVRLAPAAVAAVAQAPMAPPVSPFWRRALAAVSPVWSPATVPAARGAAFEPLSNSSSSSSSSRSVRADATRAAKRPKLPGPQWIGGSAKLRWDCRCAPETMAADRCLDCNCPDRNCVGNITANGMQARRTRNRATDLPGGEEGVQRRDYCRTRLRDFLQPGTSKTTSPSSHLLHSPIIQY